jgi:hypothetical protein
MAARSRHETGKVQFVGDRDREDETTGIACQKQTYRADNPSGIISVQNGSDRKNNLAFSSRTEEREESHVSLTLGLCANLYHHTHIHADFWFWFAIHGRYWVGRIISFIVGSTSATKSGAWSPACALTPFFATRPINL